LVGGAGQDSDVGAASIVGTLDSVDAEARDSGHTDFKATNIESIMLPPVKVDLSGSIAGDVTATLERLDRKFKGADMLSISCAKLVRVDFAAAGTMLNWVSSHCAQGRQVEFTDVHRLISAFFSVIGINELARISVRTD
jgi:ABC-type transporter Mla MlaB component